MDIKDHSQNGESKILLQLFDKLGIKEGYFVDIGAGDGEQFSNTRMLMDLGWAGLSIDADSKGSEFVLMKKITIANVVDTLSYQIEMGFNLLSIDIDGNDYWILREILKHTRPDVICFEVNSQLPLDQVLVMPYYQDHVWDGSFYYGMSYLAGAKLCRGFGYTIYTVVNNQNIIAVRSDLIKKGKVEPQLYSFGLTWSHPENENQFLTI